MHASFVNVDFVWRGVCHGLMRCQWFLLLELKWRAIDFATAPAPSYSKSAVWQLLCKCRCQDAEARIEGPVTARDRDTWAGTAEMPRCQRLQSYKACILTAYTRTLVSRLLRQDKQLTSGHRTKSLSLCSSESPSVSFSHSLSNCLCNSPSSALSLRQAWTHSK